MDVVPSSLAKLELLKYIRTPPSMEIKCFEESRRSARSCEYVSCFGYGHGPC